MEDVNKFVSIGEMRAGTREPYIKYLILHILHKWNLSKHPE
jgi:hypothetical protein